MQASIQLVTGTGRVVEGRLCSMTARHLIDYQQLWQPMLIEAALPDQGWPWEYKLRQAQQEDRFEAYVIEVEGLAQGMLYLETQWHRSGMPQRDRLVYVQAIASAPWNRIEIEDPPFYAGIGRALLLFARKRSKQIGYQGRIGLHALPGSEGFYHRNMMPEYGADLEKEGLVYFEYGPMQS